MRAGEAGRIGRLGKVLLVFVWGIGIFAGLPAPAADKLVKQLYSLDRLGGLELMVPAGWKASRVDASRHLPPAIRFTPESGSEFLVMISPGPPGHFGLDPTNPARTKETVEGIGRKLLPQALERAFEVKDLRGMGYYVSLTLRNPAPGEWKHTSNGMGAVGHVGLVFSIFHNDPSGGVREQALDMIGSARVIR
jgi:hypothetical protein